LSSVAIASRFHTIFGAWLISAVSTCEAERAVAVETVSESVCRGKSS
jgi:hypothetical protein